MTKPTITRERLQELAAGQSGFNLRTATHEESQELARMALAAMDNEPVAEVVSIYGDPEAFGEREIRPLVGIQQMPYGTKLYRYAQPAPVVPDDVLDALQKVARIRLDLNDFDGDRRGIADCLGDAEEALIEVVNRRAAMLQAQPQNAPQNIPEIIPGWIPVSERMPPIRHEVLVGCWWGDKPRWCCKWATYIPGHPDAQSNGWLIPGASWTPTHWMPLPAAPQEVK
ncbi:TPA: DUF551 domain-containing protein [Klebsiella variicola subsp. variicola]|nr:DUF551 domain-containing protein [Klebsiella variicola subsp. variicola]